MLLEATTADTSDDGELPAAFAILGENAAATAERLQQSRRAKFFSVGWVTEQQWEDVSSLLSLMFNLLFSQSVALCLFVSFYMLLSRSSSKDLANSL